MTLPDGGDREGAPELAHEPVGDTAVRRYRSRRDVRLARLLEDLAEPLPDEAPASLRDRAEEMGNRR